MEDYFGVTHEESNLIVISACWSPVYKGSVSKYTTCGPTPEHPSPASRSGQCRAPHLPTKKIIELKSFKPDN